MGKIMKWLHAAFRAFLVVGVCLAALATAFGAFQGISGGDGLWSLGPNDLINVGVASFVFFGTLIIVRHEMLLFEVQELYGNEYARKLLADGIPPYREVYFQYLRSGDYEVVNRFWLAGFANVKDSHGQTDLHIACERGHAAIADGIIRRGGDTKRPDEQGMTPLMLAAVEGHVKVAEVLLSHDPAMNSKSALHGCSALFIAAAHGRLNLVEALLNEGAEIDSFDHDNRTPLLAALAQQKWPVATRLIEAGASVTRGDGDGANAMDYAAAFHAPENLVQAIQQLGGELSNPRFSSTGGGFSRVGHIRIQWERRTSEEMQAVRSW